MQPDRRTSSEQTPPKALKKYTLLAELAKGGMAELYLARANGLGGFERLLVIKKILASLAGDADYVRMLLDEARIAATLQHSNIVQVFDVDIDDGVVFYAMEHLHGHSVGALIERAGKQRIPLENAVAVAVAVAAGLHYAHERWGPDGKPLGIVHRDVSPHNVVVTYDGNVKLIDFGIVKAEGRLSSTRFGVFKGKLPYAAPEQCRCEPVDRRADVYSLGVLLYELTTGQPAFSAEGEYELLKRMTEAVVTQPRMLDKTFPRELERIILKALARDPGDRYQTAQALQRDLEVFATNARLDLSAFSLSRVMQRMFAQEIGSWMDSRRAGLDLAEHLSRSGGEWETEALDSGDLIDLVDFTDATTPRLPVRRKRAVSTHIVRRQTPATPAPFTAAAVMSAAAFGAAAGEPVDEDAETRTAASTLPAWAYTGERAPAPRTEPVKPIAARPPIWMIVATIAVIFAVGIIIGLSVAGSDKVVAPRPSPAAPAHP